MSTADVIDLSERINESLAQPDEAPAAAQPFAPEPGIYRDIEMGDYLRIPYMSASKLEQLRRSPLHYLHSLRAPHKTTHALERGTALHLAILEPQLFDGRYVVLGQCEGVTQKKERCSKQGSVYRDGAAYCGTHAPKGLAFPEDVEVISQADYDAVLGMRSAIMDHPRARTLFEGRGEFEVTIIFDDPTTGVRCKVRPDRLIERAGMLVDIKTTFNAAPSDFANQAERLGYFRKLAFYRRGMWAVSWPYKASAVVAPESAAPHDVVCYLVEESDLDGADAEVIRLLRVFDSCVQTNTWEGYAAEFQTLRRPAWANRDGEINE